jgi:phosphoglycolate phosphatase-like HAD superfamily hydrolase
VTARSQAETVGDRRIVVSLDVDGTMEFGDPPGPVTVEVVRMLVAAGYVVGCASDRTRSDQEETWSAAGVTPAFVGGKHHLDAVRERFPAPRYVHIGDTHVDAHFAELHGFEYVGVHDADAVLGLLRSLAADPGAGIDPSAGRRPLP